MKNKVDLIRPLVGRWDRLIFFNSNLIYFTFSTYSKRERLEMLHAVTWSLDSDALLLTWSNRTQSVSVTQQCYPTMHTCVDDILQVKAQRETPGGWIPNLVSSSLVEIQLCLRILLEYWRFLSDFLTKTFWHSIMTPIVYAECRDQSQVRISRLI